MKVIPSSQRCPGAEDSVFFPTGFPMFSSEVLFVISDVITFSEVTNPKYGKTVYLTYVNITTVQED
jgi:hypothetical protein